MQIKTLPLKLRSRCFLLLVILLFLAVQSQAQYFGRNKVLYESFDFKITQTPHFDIYNYLKANSDKEWFAKLTEQWYTMHQQVLLDTFQERNPLILYNHHAHFQQTRAISGSIDVGTGGVTEALKNRVILPVMESNAQTDHVLGHELVHAFQYHLVKDSFSLSALNNLPLWMVEGMAEYMSIGYIDANTAMWLRSAVANDRLPTLKDLTNRPDLYFPYRWGEAFWAYVTGRYGDAMIKRLFIESARRGYDDAIKYLLKIDEKTFSEQWQQSIRESYGPYQKTTQATATGRSLLHKGNAGKLNIVPSISPDGKYIAYWTEKNLFTLDLYIADMETGKNIERLTRASLNSHVDQYASYESSVAWSPDSRQLAFVVFAKGRNRLLISNMNGKVKDEIDLPGLTGFNDPTWSPDGNTIVVTGQNEGRSDLYAYDLRNKTLKQLTNDIYSDIMPSFSPDGKTIVFTTDRVSVGNNRIQHNYAHNLAILDLATGRVTNLDVFTGANNMNPVFGTDNNTVYFISDRDGFRNLYAYNTSSRQLNQMTNLFTGISGITGFAPAISVSRQTGQVVYSYYDNGDYVIYSASEAQFSKTPVESNAVNFQAATLPPFTRQGVDIVQRNIQTPPALTAAQIAIKELPYRSKFRLDYIGNTGIGMQTGGGYGTGLAGGVNGIFSDMLGHHQLYGAFSLNGELIDVAGQFAYLNQDNRFNWGVSLSHVPYLSGAQYLFYDTIRTQVSDSTPVLNNSLDLLRTFEDQVSVFGSYPFSTIRRVEGGASFARYYYRLDRYTDYYDPSGSYYLGSERTKQDVPSGFNFGNGYLAYVGDNSFFGVASPLAGHRFRFEASKYLGVVNLHTLLGDYRKYFRFAPLTFATRNMYMGRFGEDAESGVLPPLFIGYPSLVRGYNALVYAEDNSTLPITINDLIGSRIYVANAELRLPLTGPERLSVVKSRFLFTELNLFTDGGIAWGSRRPLIIGPKTKEEELAVKSARFIMSSGVSLRLNLFGYLVIEPFYAIPWQNGGFENGNFGFNFIPGW